MADIILVSFTIVFLVAYPFHETFLGGLIYSFACAGLIGGIADWFAIKSFFTKPLGISWPEALFKTEMIPKNRKEVISVIVNIVQDKVITKDALASKLKEVGISSLLIDYVVEHKILNSSADQIIKKLDLSLLKENQGFFRKLARKFISENRHAMYKVILHTFEWAKGNGHLQYLLSIAAKESQRLLKYQGVNKKFSELFNGSIRRCERNKLLKNVILPLLKIFTDIPKCTLESADSYLESVKDPGSTENEYLQNLISDKIKDINLERKINFNVVIYLRSIINNIDFDAIFNEIAITKSADYKSHNKLHELANSSMESINAKLKTDITVRQYCVAKLDIWLSDLLYQQIEFIIKNKLEEYTNEMLTEEIYNSVGEDLNMVRFNGSLVGGFVGIITFIIMYIAG